MSDKKQPKEDTDYSGLALDEKLFFKIFCLGLFTGVIIGLIYVAANPQLQAQQQTATTTIQPLNLNCTKLASFINSNITIGNQQAAQTYIQLAQAKGCPLGGNAT